MSNSSAPKMGGYEANFNPPLDDRYKCPICLTGLRDPIQTKCGHRFCFACFKSLRGYPWKFINSVEFVCLFFFISNFVRRFDKGVRGIFVARSTIPGRIPYSKTTQPNVKSSLLKLTVSILETANGMANLENYRSLGFISLLFLILSLLSSSMLKSPKITKSDN